jgi:hypothetical protein
MTDTTPLLVVDADGRITILWPDPIPDYVRISPDAPRETP